MKYDSKNLIAFLILSEEDLSNYLEELSNKYED